MLALVEVRGKALIEINLRLVENENGKGSAGVEDDNGENDDLDFEDQDDMEKISRTLTLRLPRITPWMTI
jgi:hypothetical protein